MNIERVDSVQAIEAAFDAGNRLGNREKAILAVDVLLALLRKELESIHWDRNDYCNECGGNWPCLTLGVLARYEGK